MVNSADRQFCGMRFDDFSATLSRRWPKKELTVAAFDADLHPGALAAAQKWSAVSGLELEMQIGAQFKDADIQLSFESAEHGDGNPFDGPSGVLAHAFYPSFAYDFHWEGKGHFDAAERWALKPGDAGFRLDVVVLHEMGHSLGLGHNPDDPLSVMYPYYRGVESLSRDDIAGIQMLYGPPPEPPPQPGDEFHYTREATARWSEKDQWLVDALLRGKMKGLTWVNYRGRTVPSVLVDSQPPESD